MSASGHGNSDTHASQLDRSVGYIKRQRLKVYRSVSRDYRIRATRCMGRMSDNGQISTVVISIMRNASRISFCQSD